MVNIANRLAALHYPRTFPVTTLVDADEDTPGDYQIQIQANSTTAQLRRKVGGIWQNVFGATVTQAQAFAFQNVLALSYPNHRAVLTQNAQWRALYNVANRVLVYVDRTNTAVVHAAEETVPCHDCFVVCRLDANITIDHQRPQAGNDLEPVCKVFRAMGLTLDAPLGRKGVHYANIWPALVGGQAGAGIGTRNAKYTLNDIGKIYYTLSEWGNQYANLTSACLNHIINLRPLCNACNTPNRNVQYF